MSQIPSLQGMPSEEKRFLHGKLAEKGCKVLHLTHQVWLFCGNNLAQSKLGDRASLVAQQQRIHLSVQETQVPSLGWEDPLEKEMATHSSILAWKIPRTEQPAGLESVGSQSQTRLKRLTRRNTAQQQARRRCAGQIHPRERPLHSPNFHRLPAPAHHSSTAFQILTFPTLETEILHNFL